METRASYVAVGAFVVLVMAGMLLGFLWIAQVQFRTTFGLYQTYVSDSVSGLSAGAPVRLDGIDVGQVAGISLDAANPQLVTLLLKVRDGIEIHSDAVAQVESQGLTGVSYVEISGGTLASPPLTAEPGERYPTIISRPSALQQVFANAPEVLAHLLIIEKRVGSLLDDKNSLAIAGILANLRDTTSTIARRDADIDHTITDAQETMSNLAAASATVNILAANLEHVSGKTGRLIDSARTTFNRATKLAADLDATVQAIRPGMQRLATTDTARLDQLLVQADQLAASLNRLSHGLERNPREVLFGASTDGYRPP